MNTRTYGQVVNTTRYTLLLAALCCPFCSQQHTAQGYVSLAVRLGTEESFAKQALARVEEGYRESLHKNKQSAQEWGAFFVRAFRIARI